MEGQLSPLSSREADFFDFAPTTALSLDNGPLPFNKPLPCPPARLGLFLISHRQSPWPSTTVLSLSTTLSFVIPSEAEGSAVHSTNNRCQMQTPPSPLSSRPERSVAERSLCDALSWKCFRRSAGICRGFSPGSLVRCSCTHFPGRYPYDSLQLPEAIPVKPRYSLDGKSHDLTRAWQKSTHKQTV
jgi:hypothetical protein